MAATCESQRTVFLRIAQQLYVEWPTYDSTLLYDRTSLAGLESDVRVVSSVWFTHPDHDSLEQFVCSIPLAYFRFEVHDRYGRSTRYEMDALFRVFLLKELYGWKHETSLLEYLGSHPELCERLELGMVPNQSTLWRTWNERFTRNLREMVQKAARTILIKAQNADVAVPRKPERSLPPRGHDAAESDPDDQAILDKTGTITKHVSRVVFPAFSLDRGDGCEIPENAYWSLQTYLGLRKNLAAMVAIDDEKTVRGFADFRWGDAETKDFVGDGEAGLKAIYVEPDYWGRGFGSALLEQGIECLPVDVDVVRLEMLSGNEVGDRFYKARGFERTDTGQHEIGDTSYPTDIYTLHL